VTIFDFLVTPIGQDLVHAVIALLIALAGALTWLTRRDVHQTHRLLRGHLEEHSKPAPATTTSMQSRSKLHM
jgi:hypothetical protein